MNDCAVCGASSEAETFTFDCHECAIQKAAPSCEHCGCRVVGHGVEAVDKIFCSAHCARETGEALVADRS